MSHIDKEIELPIISGTEGNPVIDISSLGEYADIFTYDPGFMSTASCKSAITYIDGDAGILRHRGYDITDLAENSSFVEVAYLLLHGELPNPLELEDFDNKIKHHSMIHEQLQFYTEAFLVLHTLWRF